MSCVSCCLGCSSSFPSEVSSFILCKKLLPFTSSSFLTPSFHGIIIILLFLLQLKLKLGSGEWNLTRSGLFLNDSKWHTVMTEKTDAKMTLAVDGNRDQQLITLPTSRDTQFIEKNSLLIGGSFMGSDSSMSPPSSETSSFRHNIFVPKQLLSLGNFRGCIEYLKYNGAELLDSIYGRNQSPQGSIYLSPGCSKEFEANSSQVTSFVDPGSFMQLQGFPRFQDDSGRPGGSFEFSLRTSSMNAVLFYATQESNNMKYSKQYIVVELVNGNVELSINDGTGVVSIQSDFVIRDGQWHDIKVVFSPVLWEINVDGRYTKTITPSVTTSHASQNRNFSEYFNLDQLYVGGIDVRLEFIALQQGLRVVSTEGGVVGISLVGCIKDIRINREPLGVREASSTRGLSVSNDCLWKFVCILEDPCVNPGDCFQEGLDGFQCLCDSDKDDDCIKPSYREKPLLSSHRFRGEGKRDDLSVFSSKPKKPRKEKTSPALTSTSTSHPPSSTSASTSVTKTVLASKVETVPERAASDARKTQTETDDKTRGVLESKGEEVTLQEVHSLPHHPLNYLGIALTNQQLIIGLVCFGILFIVMLLTAVIRECYLLGRRNEGRKRSRQEGSRKDDESRNHSALASSDPFSGMAPSSSPLTSVLDVDTASHSGDLLMMSSASLSPSTPLYAESIDSQQRQQRLVIQQHQNSSNQYYQQYHHKRPSSSSSRQLPSPLYSRVDKRTHPSQNEKNLRNHQEHRESTLIPPLPPPELYFSTTTGNLSELPSSCQNEASSTVFSQDSRRFFQNSRDGHSHGASSSSGCESGASSGEASTTTAGDLDFRLLHEDEDERRELAGKTASLEDEDLDTRDESRCFLYKSSAQVRHPSSQVCQLPLKPPSQKLLMTTFSQACPASRVLPYDPYSLREESRGLLLYDTPRPEFSTLGRKTMAQKPTYASVNRRPVPLDFSKNLRPNVHFSDSNQVYGDIYDRRPSFTDDFESRHLPDPPADLMRSPFEKTPRNSIAEQSPPFPSLKEVPWSSSSCDDMMSQLKATLES